MSEHLTVEQAIAAINAAPDGNKAMRISNDVAFAASKGMRPESDADAVRKAYFARWGEDSRHPWLGPPEPIYGTRD